MKKCLLLNFIVIKTSNSFSENIRKIIINPKFKHLTPKYAWEIVLRTHPDKIFLW